MAKFIFVTNRWCETLVVGYFNWRTIVNLQEHLLAARREEYDRWEKLLIRLSDEQITSPLLPSNWSVKDVIAHLWAWQQRSIARLEAARFNREPEFPNWLEELDPDSDGGTDRINAGIYATYRDKPWSTVHQDWREGFLRFLELGSALSEKDLLEKEYTWFKGYPLYVILASSYAHHQIEHLEPLLARLRQ